MSSHAPGDREGAWRALEAHARATRGVTLRERFAADPGRFERLSREAVGFFVDLSKTRVDAETLRLLLDLARASGLEDRRERMFRGERVNETEGRAALHVALRNLSDRPILVDGRDVMPDVRAVLGRMRRFAEAVRSGAWRGFTGKEIRTVVNVGIGGSDLGPEMAATALEAWRAPEIEGRFVSNLDAAQLDAVLRRSDPERTLFLVASKTFSTLETLTNARSARAWLVAKLGDERAVARHFVALSTHAERVKAFGIDLENMFPFWDWVGGRTSLWSAIGLSVELLVGPDRFEEMLRGAHEMDEHFRSAPLEENLPVLLGLVDVFHTDFLGTATHAILPYDWALRLLPAYLQQLEMESNGKCVRLDGTPVDVDTCPIVWGGPGNNGQHAFYQLLHQGTRLVLMDFLVAREGQADLPGHQDAVLASALAQTEALMRGRTLEEAKAELRAENLPEAEVERLAPHKVMPGNRPSTTILYDRLTPGRLGALVALYEHQVFVASVIWGTNAFDQWGVELGKTLTGRILGELRGGAVGEHDASTAGLIDRLRR